jgi:hypothetical protein
MCITIESPDKNEEKGGGGRRRAPQVPQGGPAPPRTPQLLTPKDGTTISFLIRQVEKTVMVVVSIIGMVQGGGNGMRCRVMGAVRI